MDKMREALARIKKHMSDYVNDGDWPNGEVMQIDADLKTLQAALQSKAVTSEELVRIASDVMYTRYKNFYDKENKRAWDEDMTAVVQAILTQLNLTKKE